MKELSISRQILDDILDGDTQFGEALRKVFQPDESIRALRPVVAGLVGCELRHHLMFDYILSDASLEDFNESDRREAALALADLYFFKRIEKDDVIAHLKETIGEEKLASLTPYLEKAGNPKEYMPEVHPGSTTYLSLRFNTPTWVIKILEHFGNGTTYKVLHSNSRPARTFVRLRQGNTKAEDLIKSGDFAATAVPEVLEYVGKTPLRKQECFRRGIVYEIRPATKAITDKYRVEDPKEALLFCGAKETSIIDEFIESYGEKVGLNIGVYSKDKFVHITKRLRDKNLKNINFFEAQPDAMVSHISKPQSLVFCVPDSTDFDAIPSSPDFLLHFKTEDMDGIYQREKTMLEGCAAHVEEGGLLVYLIYTISKKEGPSTINAFVADHPEFHVVEMKQGFPFEDLATSYFVAVLKKETLRPQAETPLVDLSMLEGKLNQLEAALEPRNQVENPLGENHIGG